MSREAPSMDDLYGIGAEQADCGIDRQIASCIGCGCDDNHACPFGCYWLRVDRNEDKGVCSGCVDHCEAWDRGERTSHAQPISEIEAEMSGQADRMLRPIRTPPENNTPCQHDWPYDQPDMDDHCRWCGISFTRYVYSELP